MIILGIAFVRVQAEYLASTVTDLPSDSYQHVGLNEEVAGRDR